MKAAMKVKAMNKALVFSLLLISAFIAGCAQQQPQNGSTQDLPGATGSGTGAVQQQVSQQDMDSIGSEISELETMLEDSSLDGIKFIQLDESTFQRKRQSAVFVWGRFKFFF